MSDSQSFTHFDEAGNARMVDVGGKDLTARQATAEGSITMSAQCYEMVKEGSIAKGDVLGVARVAGIMAAKKVDDLIPMAHPLAIDKATVDFSFNDAALTIEITATVGITGKTGVEMEALTAVSITALTIYDMCKAVDKGMTIGNIRLLSKSGGKSGTYQRTNG
ncbi:MAG: cyclic pyranopterin monophosphate synthase MoaC [Desulfobulbaceae bacterium]|nr:cyclic pyranopterin monophosphate synthase MoaC [Desulfobulbaceae bacterium]